MEEFAPGTLVILDEDGASWNNGRSAMTVTWVETAAGEAAIVVGRLHKDNVPTWMRNSGFYFYVIVTRLGVSFSSSEKLSLPEVCCGV